MEGFLFSERMRSYRLVLGAELMGATLPQGQRVVPPFEAERLMRSHFTRDDAATGRLLELLRELDAGLALPQDAAGLRDARQVVDAMVAALGDGVHGRLVLLEEQRTLNYPPVLNLPQEPPPIEARRDETLRTLLRLVDGFGQPVTESIAYSVAFNDGSGAQGKLSEGESVLEAPPGDLQVRFDELHPSEWFPRSASGDGWPQPGAHVRLLDRAGEPVPNVELQAAFEEGGKVTLGTGVDGWAHAEDSPSGPFRVSVDEYLHRSERVAPGAPRQGSGADGTQWVTADILQSGVAADTRQPVTLRVADQRRPAYAVPAGVFPFDSAFPGPQVFDYLQGVCERVAQGAPGRAVLFGHADKQGSDDYNKALSDRRAQAIYALLTQDLPRFDELDKEEEWDLEVYRAILQLLGCKPGSAGAGLDQQTQDATERFQRAYNDGLFHNPYGPAPGIRHKPLGVDGKPGSNTKRGMRDAYLAHSAAELTPEHFAGPRFVGCSEFNRKSATEPELNRRVSLVLFAPDVPAEADFPCAVGDLGACKSEADVGEAEAAGADGRPPILRCRFYRSHVSPLDAELTATGGATAATGRRVVLRLAVSPKVAVASSARFLLRALDGSYLQEVRLKDEHLPGSHAGEVTLVFEDVPDGVELTLETGAGDGSLRPMFAQVSYGDLARLGEDGVGQGQVLV